MAMWVGNLSDDDCWLCVVLCGLAMYIPLLLAHLSVYLLMLYSLHAHMLRNNTTYILVRIILKGLQIRQLIYMSLSVSFNNTMSKKTAIFMCVIVVGP